MNLEIEKQVDRDSVIVVLARNGYTVRQFRKKEGSKYKWFVEAIKNDGVKAVPDRDALPDTQLIPGGP